MKKNMFTGKVVCYKEQTDEFAPRGRNANNEIQTNDALLVIRIIKDGDGRRVVNYYECYNFRTRRMVQVFESEVGTFCNDEYLENLRKFHSDSLQLIDSFEECMKDMESSEITTNQYMLWKLDKIYTKQGSTKKERLSCLEDVFDELS